MDRLTGLILCVGILSMVILPSPALCTGGLVLAEAEQVGVIPVPPTQNISIIGSRQDGKFVTTIEPFKEFRLTRLTRVTWANNAEVPIRLRLGAGKQCREVSNIMMLILGSEFISAGCYATKEPIPAGGALETRFEEEGQFPYEIEFIGENVKESGIIKVY